ncbi:GPI transamidase component [Tulasnella sp. 403]|nr:GPI transamidase component [Tulasnella sp. 403]
MSSPSPNEHCEATSSDEPLGPPGAPPIPPYQRPQTRLTIVLWYWLVILLGVPLWWKTTSIERLSLPKERMEGLADLEGNLKMPVLLHFDTTSSHFNGRELRQSVEVLLSTYEHVSRILNITYTDTLASSEDLTHDWYSIRIVSSPQPSPPTYELHDRTLVVSVSNAMQLSALGLDLSDTLSRLLVPPPDDAYKLRVVQYAPRYRLAFSLLNEDASVGGAARGWEIEDAIRRYLGTTLRELNTLHNFTIESQVQFHAPLAFDPTPFRLPETSDDTTPDAYVLEDDQLKVFVNSAEWTLASSATNDPVLHFLLFVPAANRRPLVIQDKTGQLSSSNAFLIPQWGGIVILNPTPSQPSHLDATSLFTPFSYFNTQLRSLLGVPSLPPNFPQPALTTMSTWHRESLLRYRTIENTRSSVDTTNSIIKLVDRIKGMPVGKAVRADVNAALDALEQVRKDAQESNSATTLLTSARAFVHSSLAFFNPTMVAMLYFPAEHKYAVYTPLFAPVTVPLAVALVRELVAARSRRRRKTKTE